MIRARHIACRCRIIDAAGATTVPTRTVNVIEAPPHTPPVAVILEPANGAVLNPDVATELGATIGDPNVDDCITDPHCVIAEPTYRWLVRFGEDFGSTTRTASS